MMSNYTDNTRPRSARDKQEFEENQYIAKIKRIPQLSEEEEIELLTKWQELKDLKARNRVIEANLRHVLPIAKATTKRFRFTGLSKKTQNYQTRVKVFGQFWLELISAGSLGLCEAADCFDPTRGHKFAHYARRCIARECIRAAKRLLSSVDRPYYAPTPADMMLDPTQPDPVSPHDYAGSRARPTTGSDSQEEPLGSVHARLRPWPKDWEVRFEREESIGSKIYDLRKAGLTLKETADKLGMSTTTVWRKQQAYMEARHA
jgi:hypothetical protein